VETHGWFATKLEQWGDKPALISEAGEIVTYVDLARRADDFAARVAGQVLLLQIFMENAIEPVVAYLGALRARIPVILSADDRGGDGREGCRADAVFRRMTDRTAWRLDVAPTPWAAPPHPELALLLSTSGSTGAAKLVKLSASNLQANANAIADYLGLDARDRAITTLPLSYSYGLSVLNSHLAAGGSIVLSERSIIESEFRSLVERHGVTGVAGVPYSYELMQRAGFLDELPSSLRMLTQAGGCMAPDMIALVAERALARGVKFYVMYGQTEATARMAYLPPERLFGSMDSIGSAVPGGELWIETTRGRRARLGCEGELVYRGPNVMMGYASRREDLAASPGPDVLRTGDLAVEISRGVFRITGRKSRFVKPYGLRVSLDHLETRIREVGARAIVAGSDELIVVMSEPAAEPIVRRCLEALDLPAGVFEVVGAHAPPKLTNGKPDYAEIMRLGLARRGTAAAPAGAWAEVEALFQRIRRGRPVSADMSFEMIGGDSLSYVQCTLLIEEALGEVPRGWERLTLKELRRIAPVRSEPTAGVRWVAVESDILIRCLAILLVVQSHAIGWVAGGADVLMMLAGYNWNRFQSKRLAGGASWQVFTDYIRKYVVFYVAVLLIYSLWKRDLAISHLAFYSTFLGDWRSLMGSFWFIESLSWCVAFVCLAAAAPIVRRGLRTRPLAAALSFVGIAELVRLVGAHTWDAAGNLYFSPDQMLLYFAVGWAAAASQGLLRAGLLCILVFASGQAWGWGDTRPWVMLAAATLLAAFDRISLPAPIRTGVTLIAAASFYIYIFDALPRHAAMLLHGAHAPIWALQILATLVGGLGIYRMVDWFSRRGEQGGGRSAWETKIA
jgi:acyl-CoA synthetase (AMP-forming)/AMP-acid ligase II